MNMWEKSAQGNDVYHFSLYINFIAGARSLQSWVCTPFDIRLVNTYRTTVTLICQRYLDLSLK